MSPAEGLADIRQTMKFYDQCLDSVRQRHGLSRLETVIISFLHNNPGRDTVGEIADIRMLSRGNVSRGAYSLIRRGLLDRLPDQKDRRSVHLLLRPEAAPVVGEIEEAMKVFRQLAFAGFSDEDMAAFRTLNQKLADNVSRNLERSVSGRAEQ